ncbi:MAG TPA: phage tail tube protein [Pseudolabrys sp.]|nr:phage tail tube protein [Pseudolabrys sp.]
MTAQKGKDLLIKIADGAGYGIAGYQIVIPSFGTVQGPFQITSLEFAGDHNGEVTYDMALESAGELAFAANT